MIKVLVVEDQKMVQDSITQLICSDEKYKLAGAITNAANAEGFCMGNVVDLIIMDVCTEHDESGLEAAKIIKKRFPRIKVIIVTSMAECSFIERAKEAKADSFWYKNVGTDDLLDVMDRTIAGESIYPARTPEVPLGLVTSYDLTKAEWKVIRALMESADYEEAAELLGCSTANIRYHLNNILDKTGYRNRMELLIAVSQKKLVITNPDKKLMD